MMPYYPARDGHPSMFTLDDNASAATVEPIHSTIRRAVLVARPRDLDGRLRSPQSFRVLVGDQSAN
jgi:hypothetical protein